MKEIPSGHMDMRARTNTGHAFVAINVGVAVPIELFKARMDMVTRSIKLAPTTQGARRIDLPAKSTGRSVMWHSSTALNYLMGHSQVVSILGAKPG